MLHMIRQRAMASTTWRKINWFFSSIRSLRCFHSFVALISFELITIMQRHFGAQTRWNCRRPVAHVRHLITVFILRNCLFMLISEKEKKPNCDEEIKWFEIKSNELCKWWIAVDDDDDESTTWKMRKNMENSQILTQLMGCELPFWPTHWNWWIYIFWCVALVLAVRFWSNQFGNFIMRAPCNFLVCNSVFSFFSLTSSSSTEVPCARHAIIPHLYSMWLDCNSSWFSVSVAAAAAASGTRGRSSCRWNVF